MIKKKQKFHMGDHVKMTESLNRFDFEDDTIITKESIVQYSYSDRYGGDDIESYSLYVKGEGESSWYSESQLELIKENRCDLLKQWKDEQEVEEKIKSDLDWIFENSKDHLDKIDGTCIQALGACFGLTNLWGSSGEGMTWFSNAQTILQLAKPFLDNKDKDGWLEYCKNNIVIDHEKNRITVNK